ncbi:MAG: caspase family protein [Acidimicrobiia bacterium]|nr:caspase family protein [Acidimicrobiia bacterium]
MKRALLIGIDEYDNVRPLAGCVNDVTAVRPLLARNDDDSPNFECQLLTGPPGRVGRPALLQALADLFAPGADVALLYFAGHGINTGNDVTLVTTDGVEHAWGVGFSEVMGQVTGSKVPEVLIVLDCCYSGAAAGVPQLGAAHAVLRDGVSILTASRSDQPAVEVRARGVFSQALCGALEGGAADVLGKVTLAGLYAYLSESFGAFSPRPTFKSNVDRLRDLRHCRPWVAPAELRRLPELFALVDAELPLDPSYEPTAGLGDAAHEADFKLLQRCRGARLVEPVGVEHLYFAAMQSLPCRLTPLGRHYWRMASDGRL